MTADDRRAAVLRSRGTPGGGLAPWSDRSAGTAWFWRDVLATFVASRAMLLLVAWFARYFPRDLRYPDAAAAQRGWAIVPLRWLDVWARWDTGFYLRIARDGYAADPARLLAFFPGYPLVARWLSGGARSEVALYAAGLVLANVAAVVALALLYRLARDVLGDDRSAARAVLYAVAFPSSFILSCFYSESLFLAAAIGAFVAARARRWGTCGIAGLMAAATRPVGVLLVVPLAWMYLEQVGWEARRLRSDAAALALVPAGLGLHVLQGWRLTGDAFAVFRAQASWGRTWTWPWTTIAHPHGFHGFMTRIDATLAIAFAVLGLVALVTLRSRSFGIALLLLVMPILASGTVMSGTRFLAVAFPAFLVLAQAGRSAVFERFYLFSAIGLQALFMAAWSQFYWLG